MRCLFFFCRPIRGISPKFAFAARRSESGLRSKTFSRRRACEYSPQAKFPYIFYSRKAHDPVRISRPKIGKRLAQRGIFQAQGEDILAKGEIPVCSGAFVRTAHEWVRIRRSEIGERLAQQDILQAESVQILAKGEIPAIRFGYLSLDQRVLLW